MNKGKYDAPDAGYYHIRREHDNGIPSDTGDLFYIEFATEKADHMVCFKQFMHVYFFEMMMRAAGYKACDNSLRLGIPNVDSTEFVIKPSKAVSNNEKFLADQAALWNYHFGNE